MSTANSSVYRAATFSLVGYAVGTVIVLVVAQIKERAWLDGVAVAVTSLPIAIIYFWILWSLRRWRLLRANAIGMAIAGFVYGLYPIVFGTFPVYWWRWEFALAIVLIQIVLLVIVIALVAWIERTFAVAN